MARSLDSNRSGSLWLIGVVLALTTGLWGAGVFDGGPASDADVPGRESSDVVETGLVGARTGDSGHEAQGVSIGSGSGAIDTGARRETEPGPAVAQDRGSRLRILGPDGSPVADRVVVVQARFGGTEGPDDPRRIERRTDSDGLVDVWSLRDRGREVIEAVVRTEPTQASEAPLLGHLTQHQVAQIADPYAPLDVRLEAGTLLCSGRCVDDLARPIAGARITSSMSQRLEITDGRGRVIQISPTIDDSGDSQFERQIVFTLQSLEVGSQPVELPNVVFQSFSGDWQSDGVQFRNFLSNDAVRGRDFALTDEDGRFWLYGRIPESPDVEIQVVGDKEEHRSQTVPVPGVRGEVLLELPRVVEFGLPIHLESGVPVSIFDLSIETASGERIDGIVLDGSVLGEDDPPSGLAVFEEVPAGAHRLVVRLANRSEPLLVHDPVMVDPDAESPCDLRSIDLTGTVYAYDLRAVGPRGTRLSDLGSPLLVTQAGGGGDMSAFAWEDGRLRFFAESPSVEAVWFAQGYGLRRETVYAGEHALVFQPTQPLRLTLPGLRALVGPDFRVRVSAILQSGTGLPQNLQAIDQMSRETKGFSRWHLSKSGGAWLGGADWVDVPLTHDGTYEIVLRLRLDGAGETSIQCGTVEARINGFGPDQHVITFDRAQVEDAVARSRARAEQSRAQREAREDVIRIQGELQNHLQGLRGGRD